MYKDNERVVQVTSIITVMKQQVASVISLLLYFSRLPDKNRPSPCISESLDPKLVVRSQEQVDNFSVFNSSLMIRGLGDRNINLFSEMIQDHK